MCGQDEDYRGAGSPSITCPRCLRVSFNANDISEGYCGYCHEFTRGEAEKK